MAVTNGHITRLAQYSHQCPITYKITLHQVEEVEEEVEVVGDVSERGAQLKSCSRATAANVVDGSGGG